MCLLKPAFEVGRRSRWEAEMWLLQPVCCVLTLGAPRSIKEPSAGRLLLGRPEVLRLVWDRPEVSLCSEGFLNTVLRRKGGAGSRHACSSSGSSCL